MKIAVAGIGMRAGHILSILKEMMPEVEFVGYFDPHPTYLHKIGENVPGFESVAEMIARTNPDMLFVGSPNSFHLEHIKTGLENNVRVFTEKPVVTTKADTMELARLLADHGTESVIVGLVLRYSQQIIDLGGHPRRSWTNCIT